MTARSIERNLDMMTAPSQSRANSTKEYNPQVRLDAQMRKQCGGIAKESRGSRVLP